VSGATHDGAHTTHVTSATGKTEYLGLRTSTTNLEWFFLRWSLLRHERNVVLPPHAQAVSSNDTEELLRARRTRNHATHLAQDVQHMALLLNRW
jgi:hypothetical protein